MVSLPYHINIRTCWTTDSHIVRLWRFYKAICKANKALSVKWITCLMLMGTTVVSNKKPAFGKHNGIDHCYLSWSIHSAIISYHIISYQYHIISINMRNFLISHRKSVYHTRTLPTTWWLFSGDCLGEFISPAPNPIKTPENWVITVQKERWSRRLPER